MGVFVLRKSVFGVIQSCLDWGHLYVYALKRKKVKKNTLKEM